MKKKWLKLRAVMTICAAFGWWGLLYPEFALTPDTVQVYKENSAGELTQIERNWLDGRTLFRELLSADREDISIRSKLLEDFNLFWEAFQNGIK